MKVFKKIIFAFAIVAMSTQSSLAEGIVFQDLTLEEGLEKAKKENKLVFIDVYATWCGPCKFLSSNVFVDENLGAFMNEHFVSLKIDGEKGDGPQMMRDYKLSSYPTMLFLDTDKELLKKIIGVVGAEQIESAGNEALSPESSPLFQMKERYDGGDREREFLAEYVVTLLNNEGDVDPVLEEFLALYPEPNVRESNEFIVFCIGVSDVDHTSMKSFLGNLSELTELHGEFVLTKLNMTFLGIVNKAVEAKDTSIIMADVEKVYPYYADFEDDEARIEKEELIRMMEEMYNEGME
ncbi:MAG: thioredoxin family protein [Crocinitomicaceae bacterium]